MRFFFPQSKNLHCRISCLHLLTEVCISLQLSSWTPQQLFWPGCSQQPGRCFSRGHSGSVEIERGLGKFLPHNTHHSLLLVFFSWSNKIAHLIFQSNPCGDRVTATRQIKICPHKTARQINITEIQGVFQCLFSSSRMKVVQLLLGGERSF